MIENSRTRRPHTHKVVDKRIATPSNGDSNRGTAMNHHSPLQTREARVVFACSVCGDSSDAFPETERAERSLCRSCFGKGVDKRPRELNDLSGKQWAAYSKSVQEFPDRRSDKQRLHGASFPQSLAERQIEIYTKRGATVLDPFVGVGTTVDAAIALGRKAVGIDINSDFVKLAKADIPKGASAKVHLGDAQEVMRKLGDGSVDFLLTSPPYSNLLGSVRGSFAHKWKEHSRIASVSNPKPYSSSKDDLGNMTYDDFMQALEGVMGESIRVLKRNSYSVWVVKDFRSVKKGVPYVNFHGDVIQVAQSVGLQLWDIQIYDQTRHRPLVCLGYPSKNYYLNIGHSYNLVFRN